MMAKKQGLVIHDADDGKMEKTKERNRTRSATPGGARQSLTDGVEDQFQVSSSSSSSSKLPLSASSSHPSERTFEDIFSGPHFHPVVPGERGRDRQRASGSGATSSSRTPRGFSQPRAVSARPPPDLKFVPKTRDAGITFSVSSTGCGVCGKSTHTVIQCEKGKEVPCYGCGGPHSFIKLSADGKEISHCQDGQRCGKCGCGNPFHKAAECPHAKENPCYFCGKKHDGVCRQQTMIIGGASRAQQTVLRAKQVSVRDVVKQAKSVVELEKPVFFPGFTAERELLGRLAFDCLEYKSYEPEFAVLICGRGAPIISIAERRSKEDKKPIVHSASVRSVVSQPDGKGRFFLLPIEILQGAKLMGNFNYLRGTLNQLVDRAGFAIPPVDCIRLWYSLKTKGGVLCHGKKYEEIFDNAFAGGDLGQPPFAGGGNEDSREQWEGELDAFLTENGRNLGDFKSIWEKLRGIGVDGNDINRIIPKLQKANPAQRQVFFQDLEESALGECIGYCDYLLKIKGVPNEFKWFPELPKSGEFIAMNGTTIKFQSQDLVKDCVIGVDRNGKTWMLTESHASQMDLTLQREDNGTPVRIPWTVKLFHCTQGEQIVNPAWKVNGKLMRLCENQGLPVVLIETCMRDENCFEVGFLDIKTPDGWKNPEDLLGAVDVGGLKLRTQICQGFVVETDEGLRIDIGHAVTNGHRIKKVLGIKDVVDFNFKDYTEEVNPVVVLNINQQAVVTTMNPGPSTGHSVSQYIRIHEGSKIEQAFQQPDDPKLVEPQAKGLQPPSGGPRGTQNAHHPLQIKRDAVEILIGMMKLVLMCATLEMANSTLFVAPGVYYDPPSVLGCTPISSTLCARPVTIPTNVSFGVTENIVWDSISQRATPALGEIVLRTCLLIDRQNTIPSSWRTFACSDGINYFIFSSSSTVTWGTIAPGGEIEYRSLSNYGVGSTLATCSMNKGSFYYTGADFVGCDFLAGEDTIDVCDHCAGQKTAPVGARAIRKDRVTDCFTAELDSSGFLRKTCIARGVMSYPTEECYDARGFGFSMTRDLLGNDYCGRADLTPKELGYRILYIILSIFVAVGLVITVVLRGWATWIMASSISNTIFSIQFLKNWFWYAMDSLKPIPKNEKIARARKISTWLGIQVAAVTILLGFLPYAYAVPVVVSSSPVAAVGGVWTLDWANLVASFDSLKETNYIFFRETTGSVVGNCPITGNLSSCVYPPVGEIGWCFATQNPACISTAIEVPFFCGISPKFSVVGRLLFTATDGKQTFVPLDSDVAKPLTRAAWKTICVAKTGNCTSVADVMSHNCIGSVPVALASIQELLWWKEGTNYYLSNSLRATSYADVTGTHFVYRNPDLTLLLRGLHDLSLSGQATITLSGKTVTINSTYEEPTFKYWIPDSMVLGFRQTVTAVITELPNVGSQTLGRVDIASATVGSLGTRLQFAPSEILWSPRNASAEWLINQTGTETWIVDSTSCNNSADAVFPNYGDNICRQTCLSRGNCTAIVCNSGITCLIYTSCSASVSLPSTTFRHTWSINVPACGQRCQTTERCEGFRMDTGTCSLVTNVVTGNNSIYMPAPVNISDNGWINWYEVDGSMRSSLFAAPAYSTGLPYKGTKQLGYIDSRQVLIPVSTATSWVPWIGNRSEDRNELECAVRDLCKLTMGTSACCDDLEFLKCFANSLNPTTCQVVDLSFCRPEACLQTPSKEQPRNHICEIVGNSEILAFSAAVHLYAHVCPIWMNNKPVIISGVGNMVPASVLWLHTVFTAPDTRKGRGVWFGYGGQIFSKVVFGQVILLSVLYTLQMVGLVTITPFFEIRRRYRRGKFL